MDSLQYMAMGYGLNKQAGTPMNSLQAMAMGYGLDKQAGMPMDSLQAMAMGYGLYKQADLEDDVQDAQDAVAAGKEALVDQLKEVPNPFPTSLPGIFDEDSSIGGGLEYLHDAASSGSWGPKNLSTAAQIAAIALPALLGGATSDSPLRGLGRGALTGLGGLGGYYGGKALANTDWFKNLVGREPGDTSDPSTLRFWAPIVTAGGGALLGNLLGGKLLDKSASIMEKAAGIPEYASPIEKYADAYYYSTGIPTGMEKEALFRTLGRVVQYGTALPGWALRTGGKLTSWLGKTIGDGMNLGGKGLKYVSEGAKNFATGAGTEMDKALKKYILGAYDSTIAPAMRESRRIRQNLSRPETWADIRQAINKQRGSR